MEHDLRLRRNEQPRRIVPASEVVLGPARHDDLVASPLQSLDEKRAEEPGPSRDEDFHPRRPAIQSTRPTQLSRFAAYQAIVRRTPSSHETFGVQPVSASSLS